MVLIEYGYFSAYRFSGTPTQKLDRMEDRYHGDAPRLWIDIAPGIRRKMSVTRRICSPSYPPAAHRADRLR